MEWREQKPDGSEGGGGSGGGVKRAAGVWELCSASFISPLPFYRNSSPFSFFQERRLCGLAELINI